MEAAGQSIDIPHRRHRKDVSLYTGFQKHFGKTKMALAHRLANPVPAWCRSGIEQLLYVLDVALPECCPDDRRLGMTARANGARSVALAPAGICAGTASASQSVR
jgi:hypothetical protein